MRIGNWIAAVTVALVSLGGASSADASPITTLFSTGVDAFGVPLAGGFVDPHYTVSPGGGPFAIGCPSCVGWVGNTGTSSWISPATNTFGGPGPFTYHTTFSLAGLDPDSAVITGSLAIDDEGSIFLNGVDVFDSVSTFSAPWSFFQTFTISSGFIAGVNTLDIVVPNNIETPDDGPTGLQLNLSGTADIPEPGSLSLLTLALGVFGASRRRNKSRSA
ncbi:MAG TPA: PEP-CTERM sorting domain-containing protein [Micropepsaceae bacterium]|nr:PEP-CTERM sorting domain-containing protein [Micropepsaceae bacterium]